MRARPDSRGIRSVPGAGAVVCVLLAALLHVLGCAHGPTAVSPLRADTLPSAAAAQVLCGPAAPTVPDTPAPEAHCPGLDQPVLQAPPVPEPAAAGPGGTWSGPAAPAPVRAAPARPRDVPGRPEPPAGRGRAALGIWRT
ncbi:hypothetical protein [Streptomyces sp. NPDC059783]|uniref:hypothetical protein n=1 Tax=Streptomyces sp. NPDC059783 TaxID=3346944 RepID=UPI0036610D38